MIVDSSALVAIVFEESGYSTYIDRISMAGECLISSATLLETTVVIHRSKGSQGVQLLRDFLAEAGITVVPFTEEDAALAFDAYCRFGKGEGHPAQLNILDCCSYALTIRRQDRLLFKGNDFARTDLPIVGEPSLDY